MLKELQKDTTVRDYFRIAKVQKKQTRGGKDYYDLVLSDASGTVTAKIWDANKVLFKLVEGIVIEAVASVEEYEGALQLNLEVSSVRLAPEKNPLDFCEHTEYDTEAMMRALMAIKDSVEDVWCRQLLDKMFSLPEVTEEFTVHSAASSVHHDVVGGLLEHTLFVTRMAKAATSIYKDLNRDLVITAAMLHDFGKLKELSPFPENSYSKYGNLIGHIAGGAMWVESVCNTIEGFPADTKLKIVHCILAHHGNLEWGSPKVPAIPEAQVIHFMDNLDAKLCVFRKALKEPDWQYNRILGTAVGSGEFKNED